MMRLMEVIGLPTYGDNSVDEIDEGDLISLLPAAIENKIPLFFLERALTKCKNARILKVNRKAYFARAQSFSDLLGRVSRVLTGAKTEYVVFKTLKPFPSVTVDLDILFFGREEFLRAHRKLRRTYELAGYGPYSISLFSPKHDMILDLHLEISVSRMVYINKQFLRRFITEISTDGGQTFVLEPPAALVTVIAHSLYKEQLLTLSDYYTTIIGILEMNPRERRVLAQLAKRLNVELGARLVLDLVDTLTKKAFKVTIPAIVETANMIETDEIESKAIQVATNQMIQQARLPYKYHPFSVTLAFIKKVLKDPLLRSTISNQFYEVFTNTGFLESVLLHARRSTDY